MRTLTLLMATLVSVLGFSFAAQGGYTVDLLFSGGDSIAANTGDTVTVDVFITLTAPSQSDAYQFTVGWDTAELAYTPYAGNYTNIVPAPGWFDVTWDEIMYTGYSLPGVIAAAGTPNISAGTYHVGTITFTVVTPVNDGTSDVTAYFDPVNTFSTDFFSDGSGGFVTPVFNGAGVNVPEPTTASLVGLGLIALTIADRRRR